MYSLLRLLVLVKLLHLPFQSYMLGLQILSGYMQ